MSSIVCRARTDSRIIGSVGYRIDACHKRVQMICARRQTA
jgi:hypothetical protein